MVWMNNDGQPVEQGFNWARRRERGIDELIGVCRGVMADGVLVYEEAKFLLDWLERNQPVLRSDAGKCLYEPLKEIVERGKLSPNGETRVVDIIMKIIGGTPRSKED